MLSAFWYLAFSFFLKHLEHAVGDDKSTDHVEGAEQNSQETQNEGEVIIALGVAHHDDGPNDYHTVNGIGTRHERGVQDGRHVRNDFDTQQNAQDDDVDSLLMLEKETCHIVRTLYELMLDF